MVALILILLTCRRHLAAIRRRALKLSGLREGTETEREEGMF